MSTTLLCSSGEKTNIWSVQSSIVHYRQIPVSTKSSRSIDWNQNNNYILLCSDDGTMALQSVTKDTCITAMNRVDENDPVAISCGIILTGSRFVITGDVNGTIRIWPVSKSGFESPVMNICFDSSQITSFVEYSSSLVYASTSKGSIIEIDVRKYVCSVICSLSNNDPIINMVNSNGTIFFSTGSGQICRLLPLIKKFTTIFTYDSNTVHYLSFSVSSLLNAILIYSVSEVILFSLKSYQVMGEFHSAANILSADIYNETIAIGTDADQLIILNAYDLSQPICSTPASGSVSTVRFCRLTRSATVPPSSEKPPVSTPIQSPIINRQYSYSSPSEVEESEDSILEAARAAKVTEAVRISSPMKQSDVNMPHDQPVMNGVTSSYAGINKEDLHQAVRDAVQPMMTELQTYVHREISELKADVVRQFSEQEVVIQRQQEQIEQLVQLLQQRR